MSDPSRKPLLASASALMGAVDSRVVPTANPCPSRDEWLRLREHVVRQENVIAAMARSVPHTFAALCDMAIEVRALVESGVGDDA